MKKNRKNIILYTIIMMLFLIYCFVINDILLIGHLQPQKIDYPKIVQKQVISNLEKCYPMNDNLDRVYFQGWAFSETEEPYHEQKLGIVLSGNNGNVFYCSSGDIICRDDVYNYYISQGRLIQGYDHGFMYSFSVLKLPDDSYNIGIYCYENPDTYGVDWKDKKLIKKGKKIVIEERTSNTQSIAPLKSIDGLVKYNFETININENQSATISGWAIIPNEDSIRQNVYILLAFDDGSSSIYDTFPVVRSDVANAFSDNLYTMSGFKAVIPAELLHSVNFETYIIVNNDQGWYTSPDMVTSIQALLQ